MDFLKLSARDLFAAICGRNASVGMPHGPSPFIPKGLRKAKGPNKQGRDYPRAVAMSAAPERLARKQRRLGILHVLLAVLMLALSACSWTRIENSNQQAQGLTNSSSLPSPEPSAECALGSIGPGTAGDATEIPAGGSLAIGVSLFGPQGIVLVESCLSRYTPVWTTLSGPCTFVGSHNGIASAPASAPVGSVCRGGVDVSGKHGELSLVVK